MYIYIYIYIYIYSPVRSKKASWTPSPHRDSVSERPRTTRRYRGVLPAPRAMVRVRLGLGLGLGVRVTVRVRVRVNPRGGGEFHAKIPRGAPCAKRYREGWVRYDDKFTPTKHLTLPPHHSSRPAAAHTDTETPLQWKEGEYYAKMPRGAPYVGGDRGGGEEPTQRFKGATADQNVPEGVITTG